MANTPNLMELYKSGDFAAFKAAATPEGLAGALGDQILASALFKLRGGSRDTEPVDFLLDCGARCRQTPGLWLAIEAGHTRAVRLILEAGANPNEERSTHDTWQLLHVAIRQRSPKVEVVRALLDAGATVDVLNRTRRTPLHHAAEWHQSPEIVELLVARGAAIDEADPNGLVPLALCALKARNDVLETLLRCGADPNAGRFTPLMAAAISNNLHAIEALLVAGAERAARAENPLVKGYPAPMTAREHAEHAGADEAAQLLAEPRTSFDAAHENPAARYATLHAAVRADDLSAVEVMLASGAYVHARQDGPQYRPLHVARSPEVIRLLLASGADIEARADGGVTPLWALASSAEASAIPCVSALIDAGADLEAAADDGTTALHRAVLHKNVALVKLLIMRGSRPHTTGNPGLQPLHLAAELNDVGMAALLLDAGAAVEPFGVTILGSRATPLNQAAQHNSADVARLLLAHGASPATVDATDDSEFGSHNAIHKAAQWDNFEVLTVLLRDGRGLSEPLASGEYADELAPAGSRSRALLEAVMNDGVSVDDFLTRTGGEGTR